MKVTFKSGLQFAAIIIVALFVATWSPSQLQAQSGGGPTATNPATTGEWTLLGYNSSSAAVTSFTLSETALYNGDYVCALVSTSGATANITSVQNSLGTNYTAVLTQTVTIPSWGIYCVPVTGTTMTATVNLTVARSVSVTMLETNVNQTDVSGVTPYPTATATLLTPSLTPTTANEIALSYIAWESGNTNATAAPCTAQAGWTQIAQNPAVAVTALQVQGQVVQTKTISGTTATQNQCNLAVARQGVAGLLIQKNILSTPTPAPTPTPTFTNQPYFAKINAAQSQLAQNNFRMNVQGNYLNTTAYVVVRAADTTAHMSNTPYGTSAWTLVGQTPDTAGNGLQIYSAPSTGSNQVFIFHDSAGKVPVQLVAFESNMTTIDVSSIISSLNVSAGPLTPSTINDFAWFSAGFTSQSAASPSAVCTPVPSPTWTERYSNAGPVPNPSLSPTQPPNVGAEDQTLNLNSTTPVTGSCGVNNISAGSASLILFSKANIPSPQPTPVPTATPTIAPTPTPLPAPPTPSSIPVGWYGALSGNIQTAANTASFEASIGRKISIDVHYGQFTDTFPSALDLDDFANNRTPLESWDCGGHNVDVANGVYDDTIVAYATAAKKTRRRIFVRWFWEMNNAASQDASRLAYCYDGPNNTSPYPSDPTGPDGSNGSVGIDGYFDGPTYITAYRHIYSIFKMIGASNVIFTWCPGGGRISYASQYFPGTNYTDWTCFDAYDRISPPSTPSTILDQAYPTLSAYNLPIIVGENGEPNAEAIPTAGNQVAYFAALDAALKARPLIYAYAYYGYSSAFNNTYWGLDSAGITAYATWAAGSYESGNEPLPCTLGGMLKGLVGC